jgi:hypothetical protein
MSSEPIHLLTYLDQRRQQGDDTEALATAVADLMWQHPEWDLEQPRTPAQWAELIVV